MRALPFPAFLLAALALAGAGAALAQTRAQPPAPPASSASLTREAPGLGRENQRVEFIRVEDAGSRVDEVRSGGQTQRITVQPKTAGAPAYQVQPANAGSPLPRPTEAGPGANGPRTWKVLQF
ncbi:MAG: hypothetical protein LBI48_04235 [Burkholderiaceae bacterium]|jgi:hypothetical protein|nr:hypothetical protein [Burkholderiaceae bacterium]